MTLVGSSPDELQAAAAELDRAADWVRASGAELSRSLGSLSWAGAAALHFNDVWSSRYRPGLASTEAFLRDQATRLREQAQQQLAASGDGTGAAAAGGWRGSNVHVPGSQLFGWAGIGFNAVKGGLGILGLGAVFAGSAAGRYTKAWSQAVAKGGDLLRYKRSPFLQAVSGSPTLGFLRTIGETKFIKVLGKGVGAISTAVDVGRVVTAVRSGSLFDVFDSGTDVAAGALKSSKNPVAYLSGVAVAAWKEDGRLLGESVANGDWSTPLPNPFKDDAWRKIYLPAVPIAGKSFADSFLRIVL